MLKIQEFLKNNPDTWEELLTHTPYCLKIDRLDDRVLFSYQQATSDYSQEIVREARGLILDVNTFEVICMPFKKFFINTSPFADNLDWKSVRVEDKLDGSLITFYYYKGEWIPASTGTIDIRDAPISQGFYTNFGKLITEAIANSHLDFSELDTRCCYMFELISPYNQLVVKYNDTKLIHIGTRNLDTLQEFDTDIGVEKPVIYDIKSIEDAVEVVNSVNFHGEGFVVVDKYYNRLKVKSDEWFKFHYMVNNNVITISRALDIILTDDKDEFLSQYPHYKEYFHAVEFAFITLKAIISIVIEYADSVISLDVDKKTQAEMWEHYVERNSGTSFDTRFINRFKMAYWGRISNHQYSIPDFIKNRFRGNLVDMVETIFDRQNHN